jgi:hypothetical protein
MAVYLNQATARRQPVRYCHDNPGQAEAAQALHSYRHHGSFGNSVSHYYGLSHPIPKLIQNREHFQNYNPDDR